jgi:hypothetical protein
MEMAKPTEADKERFRHLQPWTEKALAHVSALPPKAPKAPKGTTAKKG